MKIRRHIAVAAIVVAMLAPETFAQVKKLPEQRPIRPVRSPRVDELLLKLADKREGKAARRELLAMQGEDFTSALAYALVWADTRKPALRFVQAHARDRKLAPYVVLALKWGWREERFLGVKFLEQVPYKPAIPILLYDVLADPYVKVNFERGLESGLKIVIEEDLFIRTSALLARLTENAVGAASLKTDRRGRTTPPRKILAQRWRTWWEQNGLKKFPGLAKPSVRFTTEAQIQAWCTKRLGFWPKAAEAHVEESVKSFNKRPDSIAARRRDALYLDMPHIPPTLAGPVHTAVFLRRILATSAGPAKVGPTKLTDHRLALLFLSISRDSEEVMSFLEWAQANDRILDKQALAYTLGRVGDARAVKLLKGMLEPRPPQRLLTEIAKSLGLTLAGEAVSPLVELAVETKLPGFRQSLQRYLVAIAKTGPSQAEAAVDATKLLLTSEKTEDHMFAFEVLERVRTESAIKAIKTALPGLSEREQSYAKKVIEEIEVTLRRQAGARKEQKLLAVLGSDAPLFDKARACEQLAVVGSKKAVPALAALLGDESLGDYARFALEPIDDPSVDDALREAMGRLKGRGLAGVVNSIGVRRDAKAVSGLKKLVSDPSKGAAPQALAALGRIATDEAIETIQQALTKGPAALRLPAADACLAAAQRLSARSKGPEAAKLYDIVRKADVPPHLIAAATYHAIVVRGPAGLPLLVEQLKAKDTAMVAIALRAARKLPGPEVTAALAAELPKMKPALQVLVIKALVDRGAPSARGDIAVLAASDTLEVRLESLKALGRIGDASAVVVLAKAAGAGGKEAAVARGSLRILKAPGADAAILATMKGAKGDLRIELIDVLADRRYTAATPALLNEAAGADEKIAIAAFKALGVLAGPKDIPAMLKLLAAAESDVAGQAETAIVRVAARRPDPAKRADAVLAALASAKKATLRASLVRVLGRIGGKKAYDAVAAAARDAEPDVADAAIRALAAWPDGRAEAILLDLARNVPDRTHRILALRGYVRLLGLATDRDPRETARKYAELLALAADADSGKLVLSGLAKVAHGDALKLAMEQVDNPAVQAEAGLAAVSIARLTMGADRKAARAAMVKLLAVSKNKRIVAEARKIIQQIDKFADAITAWRVTGPYMKTGLKYNQLFDVAFEPETPKPKGVTWRPLPAGTDPKRPWILDLRKAIGGDQRVAYALTWVHSDKAQPARLELGSDDGIKAWLNGRLVHAKNVARAAVPYTDKVNVRLKAGWNRLMLKITQNQIPWEFCARICGRDGRPLANIRIDAAHKGDWTLPAKKGT